MASSPFSTKIAIMQKRQLHMLLDIKKNNAGTVVRLQESIVALVSEMEAEDVAYVEKMIGEKAI